MAHTRHLTGLAATLISSVLPWGLLGTLSLGAEELAPATVRLKLPPNAPAAADPGPSVILGATAASPGNKYLWADFYLEGNGDGRVYFDRQDKDNYHFLDRRGDAVTIGLSEAGVQQVFASGTVDPRATLRVARHGCHIGVFQSGRLIVDAFDDRRVGGTAGHNVSSGGEMASLRAEPCEEIHFADDFMIGDTKSDQWRGNGNPQNGDFAVKSLRHPLLSANAFAYMGSGKNIHSVVGEPWWDHYVYESSVRGPAQGRIGLIFAYQDEKNYGLFRWTARDSDAGSKGKREIVRVTDGVEAVLGEIVGGYSSEQWYHAKVRVSYSHVTVTVDNHVMIEAHDPAFAAGGAGVWCDIPPVVAAMDPKAQPFQVNSLHQLMKQHAVFDDVRVHSADGFEDRFTSEGQLSGGWLVGAGKWNIEADGAKPSLAITPAREGSKALIGSRRWAQYELEADVRPGACAAGIVLLHRDESNYYAALADKEFLRLIRVADGVEELVDRTPLENLESVRLKATIRHGHILVRANNGASVESFDGQTVLRGRAGLMAMPSAGNADASCRVDSFRLSFAPEKEALVTTNAIFEDELTMSDWTSPTSEWYTPKDQFVVDGKTVNLQWHRSQFPGDVELTVEPREVTDPAYDIALSVAKDGSGRFNGYVFRFKILPPKEGRSAETFLQITRAGQKVVEKTLTEDSRLPSSISIRRCGKYLVGLVNGRAVLHYRDDEPLVGSKVAFYTQGVQVKMEAIKINSNHFLNETFSSAPSLWRTAGFAIAEVTNRWQCDPRWSFFSLKNDQRKGKPAVLWSKGIYPGNVTVEFYVGNKMEGERGTPYVYAKDINVTICSDGQDLTKGYTFMFGGQRNSGSMIYRNGVEVKRTNKTIPTDMNHHRHWYMVKVEKQGNKVTYRVDRYFAGEPDGQLVYEDTQPIVGDRIAIWTYDHAIMLSKVRISGDGGETLETPDFEPKPLKTVYDND